MRNYYWGEGKITCEDQDGYSIWVLDTTKLSKEEYLFIDNYCDVATVREAHPLLENRLSFTANSEAALRLYLAEFNFRVALKNTPLSYDEQLAIRSVARSAAQNWED